MMAQTSHFITIAGNIGVGKSTLTTFLAHQLGWTPFLEGQAENPYLPQFYQDMRRWSFHSQIYFLSQRLLQHDRLLQHEGSVLQDRSIYEDAEIFARNLFVQNEMSQQDWQTYYLLYQALSKLLRPPDLIVYLKASVPTLQRRISGRGRDYEQAITEDYLSRLNELYDDWVAKFLLCPVLTVDTNNLDYVQHDEHLQLIIERIQQRLHGQDFLALGL